MEIENYSLKHITKIELESICNFVIKECFEIILDETEYFFQSKERLISVFTEGIDVRKLNAKYLQDRFSKILYSEKELECFFSRIEKRVQKELMRVPIRFDFKLHNNKVRDLVNIQDSFLFIYEAAKTHALSSATSKAIDKIWKKRISGLVPSGLKKLSNEFKAGDYFLSTIGLTPEQIKFNINGKISKSAQGILINKKHETIRFLKNEIITQILNSESIDNSMSLERGITKTA